MSDLLLPIGTRYKAPLLSPLWTSKYRILIMRELWIQLAKGQKELGIESISEIGIQEMENEKNNINIDKIEEYEKKYLHDIVANIHAFSDLCPNARKFIHSGATSCYITDNCDLILIKKSLEIILQKIKNLLHLFISFIQKNSLIPCLAYTHLQPAQLTTIGKRGALWAYDLLQDYIELKNYFENISFRGAKGTTGSEDSFMTLFHNDSNKCKLLNEKLYTHFGFKRDVYICSQTYSRKNDVRLIQLLSNLSQSFYKIANDIRLLASKNEYMEFFDTHQVGSSAMAYKQNPIQCENICSLSRYVINQEQNIIQTYIHQWCERTLDDSAIRRILFPETFFLIEYLSDKMINVISKINIQYNVIEENVKKQMPYIISEKILMKGIELGFDRQDLHEKIRNITLQYTHILHNNPSCNNNNIDNLYKNNIDEIIYENVSKNPIDYIGNIPFQINEFLDFLKNNL